MVRFPQPRCVLSILGLLALLPTSGSCVTLGGRFGLEIDGLHWRLVPQLAGETVQLPAGKISHILMPALEFAIDLDL